MVDIKVFLSHLGEVPKAEGAEMDSQLIRTQFLPDASQFSQQESCRAALSPFSHFENGEMSVGQRGRAR